MLSRLRSRETEGPQAWLKCARGPFQSVPPSLQLPLREAIAASPLSEFLERSVFLTYSSCGLFLYSYSYSDSLDSLSFELQIWRASTHAEARRTFLGDSSPGFAAPPPLDLYATAPLFSGVDWFAESSMGPLLEASKVRITLWEPPGGGALLCYALLSSQSKKWGRNVHFTVIPWGGTSVATPRLYNSSSHLRGETPPTTLNSLHFSYSLLHPFPLPQPVFFTPIPAPEPVCRCTRGLSHFFRLVINTGEAIKCVTFGIRPAGLGAGDEEGTSPAAGCCSGPCVSKGVDSGELSGTGSSSKSSSGPWHSESWGLAAEPHFFSLVSTSAEVRNSATVLKALPYQRSTVWFGTVVALRVVALDIELLIPECVRGVCRNYDLRVIRLVTEDEALERGILGVKDLEMRGSSCDMDDILDVNTGRRLRKCGNRVATTPRVDGYGRMVYILVMVDHQLPLPPLDKIQREGVMPLQQVQQEATARPEKISHLGPPAERGILLQLVQGPLLPPTPPLVAGGALVKRTFGSSGGGGVKRKSSGASYNSSGGGSVGTGSTSGSTRGGGDVTGSGKSDCSTDPILPWFTVSPNPPLPAPPPPPSSLPWTSADMGLTSPIRTRLLFFYDLSTGVVKVVSCVKGQPLLQPGFDAANGRTLATVTDASLKFFREEGPFAGNAHSSGGVSCASNEPLLNGQSLKAIISPTLPTALVL